jgi:hypothetical protein
MSNNQQTPSPAPAAEDAERLRRLARPVITKGEKT